MSCSGLECKFTNTKCHDREYSAALPSTISSRMLLSYPLEHNVFSFCSSQKGNPQVTHLAAPTLLPDRVVPHLELLPGLVASFLGVFDSLEEGQSGRDFAVIVQLG